MSKFVFYFELLFCFYSDRLTLGGEKMLSTDDKKILNQFMEENAELRRIIEALYDEFDFNLSKISHEIRNPLTLINSSLQIIEAQHPEVTSFNFWNETVEDVNYLRILLEELSAYNKRDTINPISIGIREFLTPIVSSLLPLARKSYIEINLIIQDDLPDLFIDPIKMREAFINLIKNAIDAIEQQGTITISISLEEEEFVILIHDTGTGIAKERLETIFNPFVTNKPLGSGLGLAVTEKIIKSHKGNISVMSKAKHGTTFCIHLPV